MLTEAPHIRERVWFVAHSGEKLFNANKSKNGTKKDKQGGQTEWSENWFKFKLGTAPGNTGIGFYNGTNFEPTVIRVDDGISTELDRLEALGNAIVPQVALQIFKAISKAGSAGKKTIKTVNYAPT